jgi:hypothetical protein
MIRRGVRNGGWSAVSIALIEDTSLSVEARWLLIYLLSRPDNWIIRFSDIQSRTKWGRDKARAHVKELEHSGHLQRDQKRVAGRFETMTYVVLDDPTSPEPENPSTVEPATADQSLVTHPSNYIQELHPKELHPEEKEPPLSPKGEGTSKIKLDPSWTSDGSGLCSEADAIAAFETYWRDYPVHKAKGGARRAWLAMLRKKTPRPEFDRGFDIFVRHAADEDRQFLPHFTTWLNQERWTDEYDASGAGQDRRRRGNGRATQTGFAF